MKIFELENKDDSIKDFLKITDEENLFNVYADKKDNYVYNLNNTIYFSIKKSDLKDYILDGNYHWPVISYKIYGTTRLAWLLMKLNKVNASNIFIAKKAGSKIYFLPQETMQNIISDINGFYE